MTNTTLQTKQPSLPLSTTPHLSHSRIQRFLHCPEQYRLYYLEGLRPRYPSASLVFGQVVHQALAHLFQTGGDAAAFFEEGWNGTQELELTYSQRDSWEKMRDAGVPLVEKFLAEELPRIGEVVASETPFRLDVTGLDLPFVGIIDLVGEVDGQRTLVDFKTSGSSYGEHEVVLSDQLTAYQLAEPEARQVALWVLVRTKEPKIEWHPSTRTPEDLLLYLAKARLMAREVTAEHFYRRPGMWCGWCDFLPICSGNPERAEETLVTTQ